MKKSTYRPSSRSLRNVRKLATATFGLFILVSSGASWAALRAELAHTTAQLGDTLTLSIESDAGQSRERPDLTALRKDFEVLDTSTSSETRIVNGSRSDSTRWLVHLLARHTGSIEIPPIMVGSEHTAALLLKVTEPSPQAANRTSTHVFLEVEAVGADKPIYVQQQIPYTVRLYYDDTVQNGELAAPRLADAIVEQLGEEKRYATMRGRTRYNVIERHYAIAPEKSGALRIPPASFRGTAAAAQDHPDNSDPMGGLMDRFLRNTPLANDAFLKGMLGSGMTFGNAGQPVSARSQEIALNIQPRPAGAPDKWLPAEQITLHDSWENHPPQFKVGEPVTRTITINVKGLAASQIPPLSFAQPVNARLYPEAPDNQSRTDGNVIYGISKQSVTYIPAAQGTIDIASIELPWWNTQTNAQSSVTLPATQFKVQAGVAQAQSNPPGPAGALPQVTSAAMPSGDDHSQQIAWLRERLQNHRIWLAAGLALLMLTILSFVAIRRSRRSAIRPAQIAMPTPPLLRRKTAMRALQRACVGDDRQAAASALLDLARAQWPNDPPRGLSALADRLATGGEEVCALDRSLYAAGNPHWNGGALWDAIRRGLQPKRIDPLPLDESLGALYQ